MNRRDFLFLGKQEVTNVKAIGCGAYHSMLVTLGDRVFCSGLNQYGQLGLGDNVNRQYLTECEALCGKGLISLKGGMHHSLVLSNTGTMYAFGRYEIS